MPPWLRRRQDETDVEQDVDRNLYCRGFFNLYISRRKNRRRRKEKRGEKKTEEEEEEEEEGKSEEDEELSLDVGDKALFVSKGVGDYLATFLLAETNNSLTTTTTNGSGGGAVTTGTQQQDGDSYDYVSVESSVSYDGDVDVDVNVDPNAGYGYNYDNTGTSRTVLPLQVNLHSRYSTRAVYATTAGRRLVGTTRLPAAAVQDIKSAKQLRKAVIRRAVRRLRRVPGWQSAFYSVDAVSKVRIRRRGKHYVVILKFNERFRQEF